MKAIAILPEGGDAHPTAFLAVTTDRKAAGRTPGEALDALTSQLGAGNVGAAVVEQLFQPDRHFTAGQRERLSTLMARWRAAREVRGALPPAEQAELERLVEEELKGSGERTAEILSDPKISRGLLLAQQKTEVRLKAIREMERVNALRLRLATMAANTFSILLIAVAALLLLSDLSLSVVNILIIVGAVVLEITALLIHKRHEKLYEKAFTLYAQDEEMARRLVILDVLDDSPRHSIGAAERHEQARG